LHPWAARHPADLSRKAARQPRRLDGRADLLLRHGIHTEVVRSWSAVQPTSIEASWENSFVSLSMDRQNM